MTVNKKSKDGVTATNIGRRVLTHLLIGALISMGFPSLIQAQEPRPREAQSVVEIMSSEVKEHWLPLPSPAVAPVAGEAATPAIQPGGESGRIALLNSVKSLNRFSPPAFSSVATRAPWQPATQSQASSGHKKSRAGGLALGLFGLALAGAGGYWAAKSRPYEIVTPGFTSCTGIAPNRQCVEIAAKRTKTGVNPGMYAGIGLVGLGLGVAVAGFRRM